MANIKNWHSLTNAELEREFRSDSATGISEAEAQRRLRHGKNTIWEIKSTSLKKYVASTMMDLTTVLLLLTVAAAAFFDKGSEAAAVLVMILLCRFARVALYIYSNRKLEERAAAAIPRAKVVRGGSVRHIPADRIVIGDVVILDSGDTVPCDIRLTAADNVAVCESAVTDKEGIVKKDSNPVVSGKNTDVPISLRTNMLYAASVVVSGFGIGMAVATGKDTLVCAREGSIIIPGSEDIPTMDKISDWSRICSLALTAAALIITVLGITVGGQSFFGVFLPSVAMAAACLSEFVGCVDVFTWAAALKSEKGEAAVYKNVSCAQNAANADVLVVRSAQTFKSKKITLHSYFENSKLKLMGTRNAAAPAGLLALACYCTGTTPAGSISKGNFGRQARQTSILPYDVVRALLEENGNVKDDPKYTIVGHSTAGETDSEGFDSSLLALGDRFYFVVSGRAQNVLDRCSTQKTEEGTVPLDADSKKRILSYAAELKKHGVTVCAIGLRESPYNSMRRAGVLRSNLCFMGFVAVSDRMEEGVADAVNGFRREGGRVIVFSDSTESDGNEDMLFCRAEGIFNTGDLYLDENESVKSGSIPLDEGSLSIIRTPSGSKGITERLRYINMCREKELKTAYIGYGVEDMWCMQRADASFAVCGPQGAQIPQVLRVAADGISEEHSGGFLSSFKMLLRCRGALYNLRNILSYLIMSHSARFILMLLCAVSSFPVMNAANLVYWGLVSDFCVCAAISVIPSYRHFPGRKESALPDDKKDVLYPTLFGAVCALLSVAAPFAGKAVIELSGREFSLNSQQMVLCMFVSCIVALPFMGAELSGKWGLFSSKSLYGKLAWLPYVAAAVGAAVFLATPLSGTAFPGFLMCAFMLVPVVVMVIITAVIRAAFNSKNNKKKSKKEV